jgi:hypothetical protein
VACALRLLTVRRPCRTIPLGCGIGASENAEIPELSLLLHPYLHVANIPRCGRLVVWSRYLCNDTAPHWNISCSNFFHSSCMRATLRPSRQHYLGQAHEYPGNTCASGSCCCFLPLAWPSGFRKRDWRYRCQLEHLHRCHRVVSKLRRPSQYAVCYKLTRGIRLRSPYR